MRTLRRSTRSSRGFTMVELLVVLGVSSAIAVASFPKLKAKADSKIAEHAAEEATNWLIAARAFRQDFGAWPASAQDLIDNGYMDASALGTPFQSNYTLSVNGNNIQVSIDTGSAKFAKLLSGSSLPSVQATGNVITAEVPAPGLEVALEAYLPRDGSRAMTGDIDAGNNNLTNYGAAGHTLTTSDAQTTQIQSADANASSVEVATSDGVGRGSLVGTNGNTVGLQTSSGDWGVRSNDGGNTIISANGADILTVSPTAATVNGDLAATNAIVDEWFTNNSANRGIRNNTTGRMLYADSAGDWVMAGGGTANRLMFRDTFGGAARGGVRATNDNSVGLVDAGGHWGVRHRNDQGTYFYDSNNTERFRVGPSGVSGSFGTVETRGGGKGGYAGYSIGGEIVFMANPTNQAFGIYNDLNNQWAFLGKMGAEASIYYNGSPKLSTTNTGVAVNGNTDTTGAFLFGGNNLLLGQRTPTTARLRSASGTQSGLRLEGSGNNALGELFADGNNFGLRDSSLNWALRHEKGLYTAFAENGSESLRIGAGGVTGDFGTLQTYGSGKGGFSGYSIAGEAGLFRDDGTGIFGLYDDANDNWALRATPTGATELGFGNSFKLTTSGTGVDINGNLVASSKLSAYNGALELRNNGIYFESGNHAITWNDGKGNFNLRVGHSPAEKITEAGWAYHQSFLQSNGTITWRLSGASGAVGDDITWATNLTLNPNGVLALNGDRIYGVSEYENRYINATGDTMTGTLNSTVATGTKIFSFASNGSGSMLKRISNQGGLQLSADSSLLLYAGDAHDTLAGDIGITPTGTGEEVYIAADSTIRFFTDLQNGYAGSHRMIFDANGNLTVDGALVMNRSNDGQGSLFDADYIDGLDSKQLMSWGGAFSGDWDDRIDDATGEIHFNDVHDTTSGAHTNYPASAYRWGGLLSYRGQYSSFQLYAPHQGSNTDDLWYRTGWNGAHFGWQRILTTANMGAGSGINADLVDGLHVSSLLRSDANDTATGALTFAGRTTFTGNIGTNGMANPGVMVGVSSGNDGQIQITGANPHIDFANGQEDFDVRIVRSADDILDIQGVANTGLRVNGSQVWTAATDGPGSGLAADTLDNLNSTQFLRSDTADIASGLITFNAGIKLGSNQALIHNTTSSRDKIRLWSSSEYAIGMQNNFNFGGLSNNYAMTFQMSNTTARGFWWGDSAHAQGQGAMALTTDGRLTVARAMRLGFGEGDNVTPGSLGVLEINGNSNFAGNISASGFIRTTGQLIADEMRSIGNSSSIIDLGYDPIASNAIGISTNNTVAVNFDTNNNNTGSLAFVVGHNGEYGSADYEELLRVAGDTTFTYKGNNVFHAGYMGAGTGLDADKVDGLHGYQFLRSDIADVKSGVLTMAESSINFRLDSIAGGWARGTHWLEPDGTANEYGVGVLGSAGSSNYLYLGSGPSPWSTYALKVNKGSRTVDFGAGANFANNVTIQYAGSPGLELRSSNGGSPYLDFSNDGSIDHDARIQLTGNDVLAITGVNSTNGFTVNGYKVFHTGNDGSGSGLNADLFDGLNSTAFLRSNADDSFSGTITGAKLYLGGSPILAGSSAALQVNGFMRTGNIMLHDGGNTPTGSGKVLGSSGGALTWDGQTIYHDSYHPVADQWTTARTMTLAGDLTGSATFDGSSNFSVSVQVKNDSHTHDARYYTEAEADGRFLNASGDTSTGMQIFRTAQTNNFDYQNSPISIRERGGIGSGSGDDKEAPNLNFHWGSRNSKSLWMDANGKLHFGGYLSDGTPTTNGVIQASSFEGNLVGNASTASKWENPITLSTSGDTTGAVSFDGSSNVNLNLQVQNDSHSHQFANLTGKTAGTGDYATTGDLVSGRGSGGVALTVNDGYGNANITFNHQGGKPEQNGNAARIEFNADSTSNPTMYFELGANVAANTATALTETLRLSLSEMTFKGQKVMHLGNDGAGSGFDADLLDGHNLTSSSTGSTVAERDSAGDLHARLFRSEYDVTNGSIGFIMTQVDTASNNYIRPSTPAQFRASVTDGHYLSNTSENAIGRFEDIFLDDQLISTDDVNTYLQFDAADSWRVVTGGTERFSINNTYTDISNRLRALSPQAIEARRGMTGGYGASGSSGSNWGANIWSIGESWAGTGYGSTYSIGSYGLSWLRDGHANINSIADEGLYLRRNNSFIAALGYNGAVFGKEIFAKMNQRVFHDSYHPNADKWTTARTLTLGGDLTGNVTFDGSSNFTLSASVKNDSHTHDGRYYTETESNTRFLNASGDTATGDLKVVKNNAWLSIDSSSSGANGVEQGAGISIGESGYKGSAALHLTYTGDGRGYIGMGAVDATTNIPAHAVLKMYYTSNVADFYATPTVSGQTVWHRGNDGSGSGMDADKLDGIQASQFFRNDVANQSTRWDRTFLGSVGAANAKYGNDTAGLSNMNNLSIGTWYGFSIHPTISGQPVALDKPAFSVNARNGDMFAAGDIYERGQSLSSRYLGKNAKAVDADKLDGLDSSQFVRSDIASLKLGDLTLGESSIHFRINGISGGWARGNFWKQPNSNTTEYGVGVYGSGGTSHWLYIGSTATPWTSYAMRVARNTRNVEFGAGGYFANTVTIANSGTPGFELRSTGGGSPYIDFSNDGSIDFDARVQLSGNDALNITGVTNTSGLMINGNKVFHSGNDGSGSGLSADNLDGINSSSFLRSDANDSFSGDLVSTSRNKGIFGTYDSNKTDQIWSMGTSFRNSADGSDFGNLYGLAYKHTNNPTGGAMAGGHQMVWVANGSPKSAMGTNIWTSGSIYENNQLLANRYLGKTAKAADSDKLDGLNSSQFLRSDANDVATGQIRIQPSGNIGLATYTNGGLLIGSSTSGIAIDADEIFSTGNLYLKANSGNLVMSSTGNFTHNGNQVYTAAYHPLADKWSQARSISLNGDATGTVSLDGSSNVSMTVAVANDSHTHDTRYYTKAQADARYLPIGGKAADSNQLDGIDSTGFQRLNYIDTSNQYLFRHRNSSSAVLYANQTGSGDIARFYKGAAAGDTSGASYVTLKNNGDIISSGSLDVNGTLTFGTSNHRISQVNSSRISYRSGHASNAQIELRTSENEFAGGIYGSESGVSIRNNNAQSILYGSATTSYLYANGQIGVSVSNGGKTALRYNNSEKIRTTSTGGETIGTHLADRITDRNNTSYYLDMNSISRLGDLRADIIKDPNDPNNYYLDLNGQSVLNKLNVQNLTLTSTHSENTSCTTIGSLSKTASGELLVCSNKSGSLKYIKAGGSSADAELVGTFKFHPMTAVVSKSTGVFTGNNTLNQCINGICTYSAETSEVVSEQTHLLHCQILNTYTLYNERCDIVMGNSASITYSIAGIGSQNPDEQHIQLMLYRY